LSLDDPGHLDSGALRKMLDVQIAQEVLRKRGSAIYVLGDPRFQMGARSDNAEQAEPFLTWTGVQFAWDGRPGDTVERSYAATSGPFKPIADKPVRWNYSLAECRPHDEEYAKAWDVEVLKQNGRQPAVAVNRICENSYGNALVFSVAYTIKRR
jgi:hypothetical protein